MGVWRDNKATIVAGGIVAALVLAVLLVSRANGANGAVAVVHDADGATYELPLDRSGSVTVSTSLGTNVVVVEEGAAHMAEADCPHGDCLRQRAISRPGEQLVCLPHRLWVEVVAAGSSAGEDLDVNAVTWDDQADSVDLLSR